MLCKHEGGEQYAIFMLCKHEGGERGEQHTRMMFARTAVEAADERISLAHMYIARPQASASDIHCPVRPAADA